MITNLEQKAIQNMIPNDEVLARFAAIMPQEILDAQKRNKATKFDFAMSIIYISVKVLDLCTVEQAWDAIFGKGTYNNFKNAIYDILKEKIDSEK